MFETLKKMTTRAAVHVEFCDECGCVCDARDRARGLRDAQRTRALGLWTW